MARSRLVDAPRMPSLLLVTARAILLSLLAVVCATCAPSATMSGNAAVAAAASDVSAWPAPVCLRDAEGFLLCHNGILQVRPSRFGIIWFDFRHPREERWYISKNNLNLMTLVPGTEWQNTELDRVIPTVEPILVSPQQLVMRYQFAFPNGARIYADMTLKRGEPSVAFEVHREADSAEITGFQWHVTFGQAEAVDRLEFGGRQVLAGDLALPLPGGRVEVQHHEFIRDVRDLEFRFSGSATNRADPNNPPWMTRVLGLRQRVTWGKPMRSQDHFAFEARDQPWQPDWGVPEAVPWIEGLWFIRNDPFVDGDRLTYTIDNFSDYL